MMKIYIQAVAVVNKKMLVIKTNLDIRNHWASARRLESRVKVECVESANMTGGQPH